MRFFYNKKGFTLVEMLVVFSIISLLAAMIIPSLQGSRIKANDARYAQELVALHQSLILYRFDHGTVPSTDNPLNTLGPMFCTDFGGFTCLDDILAPLVSGNYIAKIPHYFAWQNLTSQNWAYVIYEPGAYNYGNNPAVEFSCNPVKYATWKPGTLPGILLVETTEILPFPLGYTECDVTAGNCLPQPSSLNGSVKLYCIQLQ